MNTCMSPLSIDKPTALFFLIPLATLLKFIQLLIRPLIFFIQHVKIDLPPCLIRRQPSFSNIKLYIFFFFFLFHFQSVIIQIARFSLSPIFRFFNLSISFVLFFWLVGIFSFDLTWLPFFFGPFVQLFKSTPSNWKFQPLTWFVI